MARKFLMCLFLVTHLYGNSSCQKIHLHQFNQDECLTKCEDGLISDFDTVVFSSEIETSETSSAIEVHFQTKTKQDEKYTLLCDIKIEKDCKNDFIKRICNDNIYSGCCNCITSLNGFFFIQIRIKASVRLSRALIRGYIIRSSDHVAVVSEEQLFPRIYDTTNITSHLTINNKVIEPKSDLVQFIKAKDLIISYECKGLATPCMIEISTDDSIYTVQGKEHAIFFRAYNKSKSVAVIIKHAACSLDINPTFTNIIVHLEIDSSSTEDEPFEHNKLQLIGVIFGALTSVLLVLYGCVRLIHHRKRNQNKISGKSKYKNDESIYYRSERTISSEGGMESSRSLMDNNKSTLYNGATPIQKISNVEIKITKNVFHTVGNRDKAHVKDTNCNERSKKVWHLLYTASFNGYTRSVQRLIQNGANVNEKSTNGCTALYAASQQGHTDIVKLLIKNKANVNERTIDHCTALYTASLNGHKKIIELLIQNQANVNERTKNHCTALYAASQNGHTDIVKLLITYKAHVNTRTIHHCTALYTASENGHTDIVKYLIENKAKVNEKAINKCTALYIASQRGHIQIVELLILNGAKFNERTRDKCTALYTASLNGHKEIATLLIQNGAKVNEKTTQGWTALHAASNKGHIDIVKNLILNSANVNETTKSGFTALSIAKENDHKDIIKYLIEKGANSSKTNFNAYFKSHTHC